jgi:Ferritin-like domain
MTAEGVGGIVVAPTLPPPPAVPILPTVPSLPVPTLPSAPTMPGSGTTGPLPATSSPPPTPSLAPSAPPGPASSGPTPGTSGLPSGPSTSPTSASSSAECTSPTPTTSSPRAESTASPGQSSTPESSIPPSEPEQVPTHSTECEVTGSDPDDGSTHPLPGEVAVSELEIVAAAARLEALAVDAYTIAREAGTAGRFGDVPPALADYLDAALGHHRVALEAWNRVLAAAGRPTVFEAPADLATPIAEQFAAVTDGVGAARVALGVEQAASATYLEAVGKLVSEPAIRLSGSMLSIDQQHLSLLLFAVGEYPVAETSAIAESGQVGFDS